MSSFATISVENGIATVALDSNSDKINVLGPEPLAELDALADQIADDADIAGVILLSNKPGGFVAGADIGLIESVTDAVVDESLAARGQETFNKWSHLSARSSPCCTDIAWAEEPNWPWLAIFGLPTQN